MKPPVEVRMLSPSLKDWFIETEQVRRGGMSGYWNWKIEYPISRYAIVGTKPFKTKGAARRDAYRAIRLLINRHMAIQRQARSAGEDHGSA